MKIPIAPNSVDSQDLIESIKERFPEYQIHTHWNATYFAKSKTVGVAVSPGKNKIKVNGNFPTMGARMLFAVSLVLMGVLIPLIIYFVAFHGEMKELESEIGGFIQSEYLANEESPKV